MLDIAVFGVQGVSIEQLAIAVDDPLRTYLRLGGMSTAFDELSDSPRYEQEGDLLEDILEMELDIPRTAAEALASTLIEQDPARTFHDDEPFYSDGALYERKQVYGLGIPTSGKTSPREFNASSASLMTMPRACWQGYWGAPGTPEARDLPILEVGPGHEVEIIFRARKAQSDLEVLKIAGSPAEELGPPPPKNAVAGRMNPAGISVFYGALSEDTAVAEARPSIGGVVIVGKFRPVKRLRLLDLSRIGTGATGSIFAHDYGARAARISFLQDFHRLIARPIELHDEMLEYIPTQAVAEYVANVLPLDGILYASAQVGAVPEGWEPAGRTARLSNEELEQHNVVLFRDAARVVIEKGGKGDSGMPADGTLRIERDGVSARRVTGVRYEHTRHYFPCDAPSDRQPPTGSNP